jgi:chorismate-pyruvate lyase
MLRNDKRHPPARTSPNQAGVFIRRTGVTECGLSDDEIRKLDRDLRILIATNGTLTRILNVVADDEIAVEVVKQEIHHLAPNVPEFEPFVIGRVLQRQSVLKGRSSGNLLVAAESLIAVDLLPPAVITRLTNTDSPIGEITAASCLETFKEPAKVWIAESPGWLALAGYRDPRPSAVVRRYRIIAGGQPVIVITEYFLRNEFHNALSEAPDHWQHAQDTRYK